MGSGVMRRTPKYVQGFIDRHGKPRYYLRRPGHKRIQLPGLPWSPIFMGAYEAALTDQRAEIGTSKVIPGSIRALAVAYFSSLEFRSMKSNSQGVRRNIIERLCKQTDKDGRQLGEKRAAMLQREHIVKLMAARPDKPDSANGLRKALRAMMKHAVDLGWRADDPTQGVKALRPKSKLGFHRWTDAEIAQFEARHPVGSKARLALALGLYTGQARQDVIAMGPQHVEDEVLCWTRAKTEGSTGIELAIPVHPTLRSVIDATPSGHLSFLTTEFGAPFTAAGFGNWFREQCDMANLHHCSFHGLRKAASVRLAEAGCTPHEIASITGHASLKEIVRYTRAKRANRERPCLSQPDVVPARPVQREQCIGTTGQSAAEIDTGFHRAERVARRAVCQLSSPSTRSALNQRCTKPALPLHQLGTKSADPAPSRSGRTFPRQPILTRRSL